jgi:hypothetical protein
MRPFHFRLSAAKNLSSFQLLPASLFTDLLQLFLGLSLFLFPWGFQSSALFGISPSSFLNVWPIHPNFLFLISTFISSCPFFVSLVNLKIVPSHSFSFSLSLTYLNLLPLFFLYYFASLQFFSVVLLFLFTFISFTTTPSALSPRSFFRILFLISFSALLPLLLLGHPFYFSILLSFLSFPPPFAALVFSVFYHQH